MATAMPRGQSATIRSDPMFNAETASNELHEAIKGKGDRSKIVDMLMTRNADQRVALREQYKSRFNQDLEKDLNSELSGDMQSLATAMTKTRSELHASELRQALSGMTTDDKVLIEILTTHNNAELQAAKADYNRMYSRDFEKDLTSGTSGNFKRLLVSLSQGKRDDSDKVNRADAREKAQRLHEAGEQRWMTDKSVFNEVFMTSNSATLRAIFEEYRKISDMTLDEAMHKETSGDLRDTYGFMIESARNRPLVFADRLHWSLSGITNNNGTLIRIIVGRSDVDLSEIKREYKAKYGKELAKEIEEKTSGDFQQALLKLVRSQ